MISVNDTIGPQGGPKHHKRQPCSGKVISRRAARDPRENRAHSPQEWSTLAPSPKTSKATGRQFLQAIANMYDRGTFDLEGSAIARQ